MTRFVSGLLAAAAVCAAQPMITDLEPRGVQKGRPFKLTVMGRGLGEGAKIESTLPATFTLLGPDKGKMGGTSFLVEPSGDPMVGVYPVRVLTPDGISNIQFLAIGTFPEYAEEESRPGALPNSNDNIENAQPLPSAPLTVTGKLRGPERDVYRISAKAGEKRVIEVEARRCGSAIDPVVEIQDQSGRVLARSEDAPMIGLDARLEFTSPRDGFYYVIVHDARFSTQTANFYRLKIGSYAVAQEMFPLGGRRGESVAVSLGNNQKITADLRHVAAGVREVFVNLPDSPAMPLPFAVGDDPEITEPVAAPVSVPVTINGQLAKPGEIDRYQVEVTPGQPVTFRVNARELGTSKLMGIISVFDEKGVKLGQEGDEPLAEDVYNVNQSNTAGDPEVRLLVPPNAHRLTVTVEDLARRGGPGYAYRLAIHQGAQDIRLILNTPYVNVPAGGSAVVPVVVERHGYDGDVHLRVVNPPKGLKVEGGMVVAIPPMKESYRTRNSAGVLILTAEPGAQLDGSPLVVEGVAQLAGGAQIVRRAQGLGMIVSVAGATEQGSVDRQRPLTAGWLGLQLPAGLTTPPPATLEVSLVERKRLGEGDRIMFRWKWNPRDPNLALPKSVSADMPGAADIRMIDETVDPANSATGTFVITTTKLTRPAKYDLYLRGRLMVDGQQKDIVSRPIPVEVLETESHLADKTDSGR
jgi:hypothetical protein